MAAQGAPLGTVSGAGSGEFSAATVGGMDVLMTIPAAALPLVRAALRFDNLVLPQDYPEPKRWHAFQEGYRPTPKDASTAVPVDGEWKPQWWVIATNYFADPFFVNIEEADQGFPVYFAQHGAGRWNPVVATESIDLFLRILAEVQARETTPLHAAEYVGDVCPRNTLWIEVADTYRQTAERTDGL